MNLASAMQSHPVVAAFCMGTFIYVASQLRFYTWYLVVMMVVAGASFEANEVIYFYAFLLGMITAFAEVIGKFNDEPIKALRSGHALSYHVLNGVISVVALKVLLVYGVAHETPVDRLKIVVVAGLGSMMVMRSKLFNIKVGGEDVALGPDQIIKVFFRFMEEAIDRNRAQSRIDFVRGKLENINFNSVCNYTRAMLQSAQALDAKDKGILEQEIQTLKQASYDDQLKSYRLGFLLLNRMGEDFVSKLFNNPPPEWLIRAPIPNPRQGGGLSIPFLSSKEEPIHYMAYGPNMCSRKFRERLGWAELEETKFAEATVPRKCLLKGYRMEFNKPDDPQNPRSGHANLVRSSEPDAVVEGVLYQLSKPAIEYLDRTEVGYVRRPVIVQAEDNKSVEAQEYMAESLMPGLKPPREYRDLILSGAREHQLSDTYLQALGQIEIR